MDATLLAVGASLNATLLSVSALATLGGGFVLYSAYIAYIHYKYSHIPSPVLSNFFSGHFYDIIKARKQGSKEDAFFGLVQYWLQEVNSPTFVVFFFHVPMVITVEPAFIKKVLLNQGNEKTSMYSQIFGSVFGKRFMKESLIAMRSYVPWKSNRILYDPGFETQYILSLTPVISEALEPTLDNMKLVADGETPVHVRDHLKKLTLEATSLAIFGTCFSKEWSAPSLGITLPHGYKKDAVTYVLEVCLSGLEKNMTTWMASMNRFLFPFQASNYRNCVDALRLMGRRCLLKRIDMIKKKEKLPIDALTRMLLTNDKNFDMEQFLDTFCSILPVANETLASTIQLVFILLHLHPNVLEKVQQEVQGVLGNKADISSDDLGKMKYLEKVIHESIRMYYVGPEKSRKLNKDCMAGEYKIPSGTIVQVSESNLYRIAEYFHNPDVFKPERFDNEITPSDKFNPFGQGPRACIGREFSMIAAKTILAKLMHTFTVEFPEDYKTVIVRNPIAEPRDDYICTLKIRAQED